MNLRVVFIVGASRSGTTMLSHILGNNEVVLGLNELHFVGRRWNTASEDQWPQSRAVSESAELIAIARRSIWNSVPTADEVAESQSLFDDRERLYEPAGVYSDVLTYLAQNANKRLVIDQTPRNIVDAAALLERFPEARVVQLVRDPRAVLWSQRNRWRQRWIGAPHTPVRNALRVFFNYHPLTTSRLWLAAFEHGERLRNHPRFARLRFEDVVARPQEVIGELCEFLGITYDAKMLDVANVGSSHDRHDANKRGVSSATVSAWKGQLPAADRWICEKITGEKIDELGYEKEKQGLPVFGLVLTAIRFPFHAMGVIILNPRIALRMINFVFRSRPRP